MRSVEHSKPRKMKCAASGSASSQQAPISPETRQFREGRKAREADKVPVDEDNMLEEPSKREEEGKDALEKCHGK